MTKLIGYGLLGYMLFVGFTAAAHGLLIVAAMGIANVGFTLPNLVAEIIAYSSGLLGAGSAIVWLYRTPKYSSKPAKNAQIVVIDPTQFDSRRSQ